MIRFFLVSLSGLFYFFHHQYFFLLGADRVFFLKISNQSKGQETLHDLNNFLFSLVGYFFIHNKLDNNSG